MDQNDKNFQLMMQYAAIQHQHHLAQQQQQALAAAAAAQQQQQSNDTTNLILNALTSGVPTLDTATIVSYLGYGGAFGGNNSKEPTTLNGKWLKLIEVIDEMSRDVRPLYASSRGANDRLRRQIVQARQLVRECQMEVERSQRGPSSSSDATRSGANATASTSNS